MCITLLKLRQTAEIEMPSLVTGACNSSVGFSQLGKLSKIIEL